MPILFNEKTKEFHLYNNEVSYIMNILANNQLGQLYYGKKIRHNESFAHLLEERPRPLSACTFEGNMSFCMEHIIKGIFDRIKFKYESGESIQPYKYYRDIIQNYSVVFVEAIDENGRNILRLLLPDIHGRMPYDLDVTKMYKAQITSGMVNLVKLNHMLLTME